MTHEALNTFLVGGAVRDELLGLTPDERDWVVVGATPEQMLALGFSQVGRDFPVYLHPDTKDEYALARTERKSGHGYGGFEVQAAPDVTLEQDLQRRDLTINAIARDQQGQLIDPYGGQQDLEARCLRHVSDAFVEDPLRVLRAARFAARFHYMGFTIAPDTAALMSQLSHSGELAHLPAERLWQETEKALNTANPEVYIQTLEQCGAIAALYPDWHPRKQELANLAAATAQANPVIRFASVLAHQSPDVVEVLCDTLGAPNQYRDLARLAARHGMDCHCRTGEHALKLLELTDAWRRPERFTDFLEVCRFTHLLQADEQSKLLQARETTQTIDTADWVAAGIKGAAIGERVQQERLQRLNRLYG